MKKLIQICSVLSLLVMFTAASARAEIVKQFTTNVPFDFNIGEKSYKAGKYIVKVSKTSTSGRVLTLEDGERNLLQTVMISENGDVSKGEPVLVFNRYDNQRFLTKILTPQSGLSVFKSKNEKQIAKQQRDHSSDTQTVAVALNRN